MDIGCLDYLNCRDNPKVKYFNAIVPFSKNSGNVEEFQSYQHDLEDIKIRFWYVLGRY